MGSRGRSIRLRIYFLVAIPLITMVGLLAYVVTTSVNNAVNLDRAPNLINATSQPATVFAGYLQAERVAAVVYLFQPVPANLQAYNAAIATTDARTAAFRLAMTSPGTVTSETPDEARGISTVLSGLTNLKTLRTAVQEQALSPLQALADYTQGISAMPKLFLIEDKSETDATAVVQGIGLIAAVESQEALSQEQALLAGILAGHRITTADRATFLQTAAQRTADISYADSILNPADLSAYNQYLNQSVPLQNQLASIEQAMAAGVPVAKLPITLPQWQTLASTLLTENVNGGDKTAAAELVADQQISHAAWVRVAITSGVGFLGLLLTIIVTFLVGRSIIRRLSRLERTAITLAEDQLPDVIGRLRRGENVDAAEQALPLQVGVDEIGRVGQAFDLVRETAIKAAVEEARLRRGLNDVFRSLARRSQSLLHRQLTLLDQMERRASDPEALDDLFRLDHLTTRMRRHAEGLVILAGAPPGRGWSSPVRMVDVMRGAIAEVEDYARVSVATRSQAALSGSAVADVIHLLAELIENATTLSPPYTSVRVSGDTVANGFAIDIEDRGLGMNAQRIAELNDRLANPPEFNPSDSEQLGLFVVSQLAKRHGIRVTLRASPYGGTSAVVLVPRHLVVTEGAFRAGLPGEPVAITMASPSNGNHPADDAEGMPRAFSLGAGERPALGQADRRGPTGAFRPAGTLGPPAHALGPGAPAQAPGDPVRPATPDGVPSGSTNGTASPAASGMPSAPESAGLAVNGFRAAPGGAGSDRAARPADATPSAPAQAFDVFSPVRRGGAPGDEAPADDSGGTTGALDLGAPAPLAPPPTSLNPAAGPRSLAPGTPVPGSAAADTALPGATVADAGTPGARASQTEAPAAAGPGAGVAGAAVPGGAAVADAGMPGAAGPPGQEPVTAGNGEAAPDGGPSDSRSPARSRGPSGAQGPAGAQVTAGAHGPADAQGPAGTQAADAGMGEPPADPFTGQPYQLGTANYQGGRTAPYPSQAPVFPGWPAPSARPGGSPQTPMIPVAGPSAGKVSRPPWELSRDTGPLPAVRDEPDSPPPAEGADGEVKSLPRRVKQASLAPQLRANPPARATSHRKPPPPGRAASPSPAQVRDTMSALQRGWQEGRAQRAAETAAGQPTWTPPDPAERDSRSEDTDRGGSDGA